MLPLLILFLGGLVLTAGDLVMKSWVGNGRVALFLIGLVIYMVGLIFLSQSFRYQHIAVASLVLVVFNVITLVIISYLFFKETLSILQIIGLILGLIAVGLLEIS